MLPNPAKSISQVLQGRFWRNAHWEKEQEVQEVLCNPCKRHDPASVVSWARRCCATQLFWCHRVLYVAMQAVLQRDLGCDVIVRGPYYNKKSDNRELVLIENCSLFLIEFIHPFVTNWVNTFSIHSQNLDKLAWKVFFLYPTRTHGAWKIFEVDFFAILVTARQNLSLVCEKERERERERERVQL